MSEATKIRVDGQVREVRAAAESSLLSALRDGLGLTAAKYGCGEGECGACTVLLDGHPIRSCRMRVSSIGEKSVITLEGLTPKTGLHPVQSAFLEKDAMQCGYCTSGMIVAAIALLRKNP